MCAIQAVNGTTAGRLQVNSEGEVGVYKTTDGTTWNSIKSLTRTVPYGHKGSNGDYNTLTERGMWRVDAGWTNGPKYNTYNQILVVHGDSDTIGQMVFRHDQSEVYYRTGNPLGNNNPHWNAWRRFLHDPITLGSGDDLNTLK